MLALYGAVVSTLVAIWNIRRAWRDTPRLIVRLRYEKHMAIGGDLLVVIAYNNRSRPLRMERTELLYQPDKRRPFRKSPTLRPVFHPLVPAARPGSVDWLPPGERHDYGFIINRDDPNREVLRNGVVARVLTADGRSFLSPRYEFPEADLPTEPSKPE